MSIKWVIGQLRLTVFGEEFSYKDQQHWSSVFDFEPHESVVKNADKTRTDMCDLELYTVQLHITQQRIDWIITGKTGSEDEFLASLGEFPDVSAMVFDLFGNWFKGIRSCTRLALGIEASFKVESRQEGYKILNDHLSTVEIDSENSRDFMYRINRPAKIHVNDEEIRLNRLAHWSVIVRRTMTGQISMRSKNLSSNVVNEGFAVVCNLDINTDPDYAHEFDEAVLEGVFRAMSDEAAQVLERADAA